MTLYRIPKLSYRSPQRDRKPCLLQLGDTGDLQEDHSPYFSKRTYNNILNLNTMSHPKTTTQDYRSLL